MTQEVCPPFERDAYCGLATFWSPSSVGPDDPETDSTGEEQELWPGEEGREDRWPVEGKISSYSNVSLNR